MKKSNILLLGIAIVTLACVVTLVGCGNDDNGGSSNNGGTSDIPGGGYNTDIRNYSSVTVTVTLNDTVTLTLPPQLNYKHSVELASPLKSISYTPDTVRYEIDYEGDITFYDK